MRLIAAAALAAALAGALLTGCAQTASNGDLHLAPSSVASTGSEPVGWKLSTHCPSAVAQHLPRQLGTVDAAYVCSVESRKVVGDGEWAYLVVHRVTAGLPELLAAYATADQAPTSDACDASLQDPRVVWLHASKTIAVRAPYDGCRHPIEAATTAVGQLRTELVSATRLRNTSSQLSLDSQCPDEYKDMLSIDAADGGPTQSSPHPALVAAGSKACLYTTQDPQGGVPVGRLTAAHTLTSAQVDALNTGLAAAVVDPSCSRANDTRFAVVTTADDNLAGPSTLVALDGCAVQQESGWWRAGDDVRAAVS